MNTVKLTIGLAAVCITVVVMADGVNVVSSEKTLADKEPGAVSTGRCAVPSDAEMLADARYAEMCSAKMSKCAFNANTRVRSGDALAANSSMTFLKGKFSGGATAANKAEKCESLKIPAFNESDMSFSKSVDSRMPGDVGNNITGPELPKSANMVEMSSAKSPDAFTK